MEANTEKKPSISLIAQGKAEDGGIHWAVIFDNMDCDYMESACATVLSIYLEHACLQEAWAQASALGTVIRKAGQMRSPESKHKAEEFSNEQKEAGK